MTQWKLLDEFFLSLPELFIIGKYAKIRFKNRGPPCYFLEVKRSKMLQKVDQKRLFVYILDFIFYGVSRAKADLQ